MDETQLVRVDYNDDPITCDPEFRRKVRPPGHKIVRAQWIAVVGGLNQRGGPNCSSAELGGLNVSLVGDALLVLPPPSTPPTHPPAARRVLCCAVLCCAVLCCAAR